VNAVDKIDENLASNSLKSVDSTQVEAALSKPLAASIGDVGDVAGARTALQWPSAGPFKVRFPKMVMLAASCLHQVAAGEAA